MTATLLGSVGVGVMATQSAHATTFTYVVNSTGDGGDALQGDNVCAATDGSCTLRAALQEGKTHKNASVVVTFAIPGTGAKVIRIGSSLPTLDKLTTPFLVDGYSQPGASANTDPLASNAVIPVEIRGTGAGNNVVALFVTSPNNKIQGLSMTRSFKEIELAGADAHDNQISGMWIGTDSSATYGSPTRITYANGIELVKGAHHNLIGGHAAAERNVVSGNAGHGIALYDVGTNYNVIADNIVSLSPNGLYKIPNKVEGIDINRTANYNIVGGFGPFDHNVSSGNDTGGIEISHNNDTFGNQVLGNYVGTKVDGNSIASYTANGAHGINIEDGASYSLIQGNIVGGNPRGIELQAYGNGREVVGNRFIDNWIGVSPTGANIANSGIAFHITDKAINNLLQGNTIANNAGRAISFDSKWGNATGNTFTKNSEFNNNGLGIDLEPVGGVNANDLGDADIGPNTKLNFPVFTRNDAGVVAGTACASCAVEVFTATDSFQGHGEGRTYLGTATADAAGVWSLNVAGLVNVGNMITSTATDTHGNTSEWSDNAILTAADQPPVASFTSSCVDPSCSFDGSTSSDPDGTVQSYAWDFGDSTTGAGANPAHTYNVTGSYQVTLTVTDNLGATGSVVHSVDVVAPNVAPTAGFSGSCTAADCSFDGSASHDADGSIATYAWDFGDSLSTSGPDATTTHTYAASGVYNVTLTVTDNSGASASVTNAVTAEPGSAVSLFTDTFSRTIASGWGSAEAGGAYSYPAGQQPFFSADGSTGKVTVPSGGASRQAWLTSVAGANLDAEVTVAAGSLPTGGTYGYTTSIELRHVAANTDYRARLRIASDGSVWIAAVKALGTNTDVQIGAETKIAGLVYTAGAPLRMRAQVFGLNPTTIRIKAWAAADAEPNAWNVVRTDSEVSLQAAGGAGLFGYASSTVTNAPVTFSFDNFSVKQTS